MDNEGVHMGISKEGHMSVACSGNFECSETAVVLGLFEEIGCDVAAWAFEWGEDGHYEGEIAAMVCKGGGRRGARWAQVIGK
jgi:hypothetical protein